MISFFQAAVLGLSQGITELFPISSLGHSVLLPGLLGWKIDENADYFLTFLVATHFATALTLFAIYWKDWMRIVKGIFRSLAEREIATPDARLGWLLVVTTIPAGLAGVLFETQVQNFFIAPASAAFFLILNGGLLFMAERLRKRAKASDQKVRDPDHRIAAELSWRQSLKIGLLQVIALIPGFSRTGSTLAGGLMVGLSHEDALRYSFLLATPIIGAAAILKLPPLLASGNATTVGIALTGAVAAAVGAYFSARFLAQYFKTRTLAPFAAYCIAIGTLGLLILR
ncbi:MAG TPA: undecaprenyl-diphosphate phosphatase [Candidatus Paceibacterota bacterium]|nr:undecaprenyl-diphosphate phosphatase [Candidatus Paceibacterota bacterium]